MKFKKPIALFALIAILVAGYFILSNAKGKPKKNNKKPRVVQSIAVLPFLNMSGSPDQEYFSDGLTEGILNSIARLKGLKVCSRTSSFKFKGKNIAIKDIGNQLGVNTVLEGSVQHQNDRIRITVQLINVEDEFHFWSEQYDEKIDDIFALQDKIAAAIADKLEITLLDEKPAAKKPPINKDAYDLYLKGRYSWNLRTPPELKKGIDFFQQAIRLDPAYAAAYAGIADCYNLVGYLSLVAPKEAFPKALEAATKALQLDPTLAEPHASLGYYRFYFDWDWAAAEQEFRTAIALNQNYELAYDWYGYYLTAMKRYEEAGVILRKAAELDPLSVPIKTDIGFGLYYTGAYDSAIATLRKSLAMNPSFGLAHIWLGRCYQDKKMFEQAIAEYKASLQSSPQWPVAYAALGNVYGLSGDKIGARSILDTLNSLASTRFVTSYGVALVYDGLNEKDEAFLWLKKAYEERSHWLVWLRTDPRWSPIKSDKRFSEMISSIGLPY